MRRWLLILLSLLCVESVLKSQEIAKLENWTVGLGGGYHTNTMRFPDLNKAWYPHRKNSHTGVISMYAEYALYKKISVRAELAFLGRGGKLEMAGLPGVAAGVYKLQTTYWDFRVPVIYDILNSAYKVRPYVFCAPVVGFAIGGDVYMQTISNIGTLRNYNLDLSRANMAAAYFAITAGAGAKYPINIADRTFYVGLEAGYEYGITDTYSKQEKKGQSISINGVNKDIAGPRKHSGFEIKVMAHVPLSIFKKKPKRKVEVIPLIVEPIYQPEPVVEVEKSCYTLDEIIELMAEGKTVSGKTICAIDAVNFDTGKSIIKDDFKQYLDRLAIILEEIGILVEVKGHTDNTGTHDFNIRLSRDRAVAVMKYLIEKGVSPDKITYSYYGMSRPLTTNDTPEGRKLNRRVEFEIHK